MSRSFHGGLEKEMVLCWDTAHLGSTPNLSKDFLQNVQPSFLFDLPMLCESLYV